MGKELISQESRNMMSTTSTFNSENGDYLVPPITLHLFYDNYITFVLITQITSKT